MPTEKRLPDDARPDPDDLLDRYQLRDATPTAPDAQQAAPDSIADARPVTTGSVGRGKLRIYLGMAAGVGKTYAMLNEGQRRQSASAPMSLSATSRPTSDR